MPWVIHVNSIYHCDVLTVIIVVINFRVRVVTATSILLTLDVKVAHVARPKLHPLVADPRLELGTVGYEPTMLPLHQSTIYFGSGDRNRTCDLKVMSLASYLCSTPLFKKVLNHPYAILGTPFS
jgi:hypothetical protein